MTNNPYRDPARMSDTSLLRENAQLRLEFTRLRASRNRAWFHAMMLSSVFASAAVIQHMALRAFSGYPTAKAPPACPPPCDIGCRTPADVTCEEFRKLLRTAGQP